MTPTFVVEHHHHVLPFWAKCRGALEVKPRLITFDYHTDTKRNAEFTQYAEKLDVAPKAAEAKELLPQLRNDEHIMAAIDLGIIDFALVVNHVSTDSSHDVLSDHRLIYKQIPKCGGKFEVTSVLESSFLDQTLAFAESLIEACGEPSLFQRPFILDIDLDYFRTLEAANPRSPETLKILAEKAEILTIATEPEFVKTGALQPDLNAQSLLEAMSSVLGINHEVSPQ